MRRALLFAAFASLGTALLLALGGGLQGPLATRPAPEVSVDAAPGLPRETVTPPIDLGLSVEAGRNLTLEAPPEPVQFVDPVTGARVLIPDFVRWTIEVRSFLPAPGAGEGRQAAIARDTRMLTFREPRTVDEAEAVAAGEAGAMEALLKWHITAQEMRADFLGGRFDVPASEAKRFARETVIRLTAGVLIHDVEEDLVIEGDDVEVQPYLETVKGDGRFDVRHEAFELTGQGLSLQRSRRQEVLEIRRQAEVHLYEAPPGPDGQPLFDLGPDALEPTTLRAEGGAHMTRERPPAGARESLRLRLVERVHAGQTDGKSLDAEEVTLLATRPVGPQRARGAKPRWRVEDLVAEGHVRVEYPGTREKGGPFLVSVAAERLRHEHTVQGAPVLVLEGSPRLALRGDLPVDGLGAGPSSDVIHASCRDRARLGPPEPHDVPAGHDPDRYRRLILEGEAVLRREATGPSPEEDVLGGDRMTLLLRRENRDRPSRVDARDGSLLLVSFAVEGDVRLGGTRVVGSTGRLVGTGLDTETPLLVAEGTGTEVTFVGLERDQRLLGSDRPARGSPAERAAPPQPDTTSKSWVLERLEAGDGVRVETLTGGPALGLPTRLEGEVLGYDRISDRARVRGAPLVPARLAIETGPGARQVLEAPALSYERAEGLITAERGVRGRFVLSRGGARRMERGGLLDIGQAVANDAARLRIRTDGRIEIRPRIVGHSFRPQPTAEQVVRIDGGVHAALESAGQVADTLTAGYLEIALQQVIERTDTRPSTPTARAAGPSRGPTPAPTEREGEAVTWELRADLLRAAIAGDGFRSVEAIGAASLESSEARLAGREIRFDARLRRLSVLRDAAAPALATFGPAEALNEVRAVELEMTLGGTGPEVLVARGPTAAILIRQDRTRPGALERFTLATRGDVTVTPTVLEATGAPEVHRQLRVSREAPWTPPATLWTDTLRIAGRGFLAESGADVTHIAAAGPRTTFQAGEPGRRTMIWGDRFELDVAAGTATLLGGGPGRDLRVRHGPDDDPVYDLEQTRVVVDLETGLIRDWNQFRVILKGSGR